MMTTVELNLKMMMIESEIMMMMELMKMEMMMELRKLTSRYHFSPPPAGLLCAAMG